MRGARAALCGQGSAFPCGRRGGWSRLALAGLADTGTCVVPSTDEDVRLATMLPETGVILLRCSQILPCLEDSGALLRELFSGDGSTFVAFISGPSRTADIERVLTLGVHGPLALHAVLINDVPQERVQ